MHLYWSIISVSDVHMRADRGVHRKSRLQAEPPEGFCNKNLSISGIPPDTDWLFQNHLHIATWSSGRCSCPWQGDWKQVTFKVPSNPDYSIIYNVHLLQVSLYRNAELDTRLSDSGHKKVS